MDDLNIRLDTVEERISESEEKSIKIIQIEPKE